MSGVNNTSVAQSNSGEAGPGSGPASTLGGGSGDWGMMLASIAGMLGKNISDEYGTTNPFKNIPGSIQQAQIANTQMQMQQQLVNAFAKMVGDPNSAATKLKVNDKGVEMEGMSSMEKAGLGQLTGTQQELRTPTAT